MEETDSNVAIRQFLCYPILLLISIAPVCLPQMPVATLSCKFQRSYFCERSGLHLRVSESIRKLPDHIISVLFRINDRMTELMTGYASVFLGSHLSTAKFFLPCQTIDLPLPPLTKPERGSILLCPEKLYSSYRVRTARSGVRKALNSFISALLLPIFIVHCSTSSLTVKNRPASI